MAEVDAAAARLSHFTAWFALTRGQALDDALPGVPAGLVLPLYEPEFVAHERNMWARGCVQDRYGDGFYCGGG